jgi:hypothetical protein
LRIGDTQVSSFVRNRYLETLYLPEPLSPITFFAADLLRVRTGSEDVATPIQDAVSGIENGRRKLSKSSDITRMEPLADCMLDLVSIEKKHRKVLPSLLQQILLDEEVAEIDPSSVNPESIQSEESTPAVAGPSTLFADELQTIASGIGYRKMAARGDILAATEGSSAEDLRRLTKRLTDEFERREYVEAFSNRRERTDWLNASKPVAGSNSK